jgi:nicotinamidase-related amidase
MLATQTKGRVSPVPDLHRQWHSLDFEQILSLPTAYLGIGYSNSILAEFGAQAGERLWERTRLPGGALHATLNVLSACRRRGDRVIWTKYEIFRQSFPQTPLDKAQYDYWAAGKEDWTEADRERDWRPVAEIAERMQPEDQVIHYTSLGNVFLGTMLPSYLNAWGVRTVLLSGFHLDWCIEQAARACRDLGYMPIVIGDACGCGREEDERPTLERINTFFAPVLSSDVVVDLLALAPPRKVVP